MHSGANIKAATKKLNRVSYIPCTAHILNLIVTKSLKFQCNTNEEIDFDDNTHDLNVLLKKYRSIIRYLKKK